MNDREALLTGLVLGLLSEVVSDPDTAFTYAEVQAVNADFINEIRMTATDGAVFVVSIEQEDYVANTSGAKQRDAAREPLVPIVMFDQGRVRSHAGLWLYARALARALKRMGIEQRIVTYKPAHLSDGFINEVEIKGRLTADQWLRVAAWSRRWFPQLHFGRWIESRVEEYCQVGSTPAERTLKFQGL